MRIITRARLVAFYGVHPASQGPLLAWERIVKEATWSCSGDVKKTFRSADWVQPYWVFNANSNRIVATVQYCKVTATGKAIPGIVFLKQVLTHPEYDKWSET